MLLDTPQTPMMLQWSACKSQAGDALLLFRLGDFYEAFHEDAITLAKELNLTLTKRQEIPMSGIPHHTSEGYIDKLVSKGYKVAIAEQTESPKQAVGIVRREVVRIVTPGTLTTSQLLSEKSNNYIATIVQIGSVFGLALLDISTAELLTLEFEEVRLLLDELCRMRPKELLISEKLQQTFKNSLTELNAQFPFLVTTKPQWHFDARTCLDLLLKHFKLHSLDCFGLQGKSAAINASGALLCYLSESLNLPISHIQKIQQIDLCGFMAIDRTAQRHLELVEPLYEGKKTNTLLHHLDETVTPMGARLLRTAILQPLISKESILERQKAITAFVSDPTLLANLRKALSSVRDLERLIMRIATNLASARDLVALRFSLEALPQVAALLEKSSASILKKNRENLLGSEQISSKIAATIVENPPQRLSEGGTVQQGVDKELDELFELRKNSETYLTNYQQNLRSSLDIKTLKVGYTKAFGYYIDVSRGQSDKMPTTFQKLQTLVNNERFTSLELKEFEYKVLSADELIASKETAIFNQLREEVASYNEKIIQFATACAEIDLMVALATVAAARSWVLPTLNEEGRFAIEAGRHPVLEGLLYDQTFIANDLLLDGDKNRLMLITGPNMAGKSTYLRQSALLAILAQMGSFVPAKKADVCLIDRLFSRIGASDDLAQGKSTFMVEMSETANILNYATDNSLILLDEIGRGTSTYDGISIAWAVANYLLTTAGKKAKTLFATHYFELTALEKELAGAVNYSVAVAEDGQGIHFLHKIIKGPADKSYGLHVAKLAGLPATALIFAQKRLEEMESSGNKKIVRPQKKEVQLDLFSKKIERSDDKEQIFEELKGCDPERLTPLEALQKIMLWKTKL